MDRFKLLNKDAPRLAVALPKRSGRLQSGEESENRIIRAFEMIEPFLETLEFCRQRRMLSRGKGRRAQVLPVDVTESRECPLHIDLRREAGIEVRARHHARP